MSKYQDIYPCEPLIQSIDLVRPTAADLLTLEYFESDFLEVELWRSHSLIKELHPK